MSAQIPKNENVRAVLCCAVLCMIVACCTCRGLVVRARSLGGGMREAFGSSQTAAFEFESHLATPCHFVFGFRLA